MQRNIPIYFRQNASAEPVLIQHLEDLLTIAYRDSITEFGVEHDPPTRITCSLGTNSQQCEVLHPGRNTRFNDIDTLRRYLDLIPPPLDLEIQINNYVLYPRRSKNV